MGKRKVKRKRKTASKLDLTVVGLIIGSILLAVLVQIQM